MRRFFWESFKVLLAAVIGAIFLEAIHDAGYFPDKWLLGLTMLTTSAFSSNMAFLVVSIILAVPFLFAEHWLWPMILRIPQVIKLNNGEGSARIPLINLRSALQSVGWNTDIHRSNDATALTDSLNQAAADGLIKFYGRKYEYDLGEAASATFPLLEIPSEHFRDFSFQPINLFGDAQSNFYIFTGKLGALPRELRGQIYRDIHAGRTQIRKWVARNKPKNLV